MEVVSPLVSQRRPEHRGASRSRAIIAAASTMLLLALALIAVSTLDGSSKQKRTELAAEPQATGGNVATGPATTVTSQTRGSVPTDEKEANIIMGGNKNLEPNMGNLFLDNGVEERGHEDPAAVADSIIDAANKDNEDVTGKRGEDHYNEAVANAAHPAFLTGSLPTYRAESTFITSGVAGNYEKSLETGPTIANSVNPHASPRVVASNIIDEAVKGEFDCTGAVGADGTHSSGIPPCPPVEKFDNNLHEIESGAVPETTPAAK